MNIEREAQTKISPRAIVARVAPVVALIASGCAPRFVRGQETPSPTEPISAEYTSATYPEVLGGENRTPWDVGARVYVSYELSDNLEGKRFSADIPKCKPTVARAFPGEAAVITAVNEELVNVRLERGVELSECHYRWFSRDSRGFTQLTALNETSYELGQEVFLTYELAKKLDRPKAHGIRLQVVTIIGDRVSVRFVNDGVVLHDLEWQLLTNNAPYELPRFWWNDPTL